MWRALRNTVTRARELRDTDPALRSLRCCHLRSASSRIFRFMTKSSTRCAGRRLADLAPHALVDVADALALVGLGRPQRAEIRRELPDLAAVAARHPEDHVAVDRDREPLRHGDLDRMREAEQQRELLPGRLRAIADALDLEFGDERRHHALHHVGDQRAHEPVQRARGAVVLRAPEHDLPALDLDADRRGQLLGERALGPLHADAALDLVDGDTGGDRDGFVTDPRHRYHTSQSSSPPRFCSRASRSDSTPREVEITATPSPLRTRGRSSLPTYTRRPGLLTRWIPSISGRPASS